TPWVCSPGRLTNNIGKAPTAVIMPAAKLPRDPAAIGERDSIIPKVWRARQQETSPKDHVRGTRMSVSASPVSNLDAAAALAGARRIVVKIGSSLLIDPDTRRPTHAWLAAMARDLAALKAQGRDVIVVSSGSIALGRGRLPALGIRLEDKQAAASVGQSLLMAAWSD
ncbi:hypothetical protein LTR94_032263, partial [Friedmanniomyces endolithicus]